MKDKKSIIVFIILFSMILTTLLPIIANAKSTDFLSAGESLKDLGVLEGNSNGDLMLNSKLKRQDMVVLISRLYKKETSIKESLFSNDFKDIKDSYYEPYISWAVREGLILGRNSTTFGFDEYVTVQEFMAVLLRALKYGEEAKNWKTVPGLAETLGIMKGLNLNLNSDLRRGQMAVMTLNTLNTSIKGSTLTLAKVLNLDI